MLTEEQQGKLIEINNKTAETIRSLTADLATSTDTILKLSERLKESTAYMLALVTFIKSKGLEPPTGQYQA
jgi:hypothetical protein